MPRHRLTVGASVAAAAALALAACSTPAAERQARIDAAAADAIKAAGQVRAAYCASITPETRAELAHKATGQDHTVINCP